MIGRADDFVAEQPSPFMDFLVRLGIRYDRFMNFIFRVDQQVKIHDSYDSVSYGSHGSVSHGSVSHDYSAL